MTTKANDTKRTDTARIQEQAREALAELRPQLIRIANGGERGFTERQRARMAAFLESMDKAPESFADMWRSVCEEHGK